MLTLDESLSLLTAAREAADAAGVPMTFAVMDPGGHLRWDRRSGRGRVRRSRAGDGLQHHRLNASTAR